MTTTKTKTRYKTKKQLLKLMSAKGACSQATAYVTEHKSKSAMQVFKTCPRAQWISWFLVHANAENKRKVLALARKYAKLPGAWYPPYSERWLAGDPNYQTWVDVEAILCDRDTDQAASAARELRELAYDWCRGKR